MIVTPTFMLVSCCWPLLSMACAKQGSRRQPSHRLEAAGLPGVMPRDAGQALQLHPWILPHGHSKRRHCYALALSALSAAWEHIVTHDLLFAVQVFLNLVLEFVPETVYRISKHYSKNSQRMPTLFVKLYVYQVGACSSACCWHCCVPQLQQEYAHPACGVVLMVGEGGHPHNNSVRHSSPCCRWCCCVWRSSGVAGFRLLNVGLAGPGHICRQCVCVQTTTPPQFPCTADVHRCCTLSISGVCQPHTALITDVRSYVVGCCCCSKDSQLCRLDH